MSSTGRPDYIVRSSAGRFVQEKLTLCICTALAACRSYPEQNSISRTSQRLSYLMPSPSHLIRRSYAVSVAGWSEIFLTILTMCLHRSFSPDKVKASIGFR